MRQDRFKVIWTIIEPLSQFLGRSPWESIRYVEIKLVRTCFYNKHPQARSIVFTYLPTRFKDLGLKKGKWFESWDNKLSITHEKYYYSLQSGGFPKFL